jgi:hypothetical protein
MRDSTNYFSTSLSKDTLFFPVAGTSDIKKLLVSTPEEYHKLIEKYSKKGKFSVSVCNKHRL